MPSQTGIASHPMNKPSSPPPSSSSVHMDTEEDILSPNSFAHPPPMSYYDYTPAASPLGPPMQDSFDDPLVPSSASASLSSSSLQRSASGVSAELESTYCKDYSCCGLLLSNLHELLQHYEDCHVRFEDDDMTGTPNAPSSSSSSSTSKIKGKGKNGKRASVSFSSTTPSSSSSATSKSTVLTSSPPPSTPPGHVITPSFTSPTTRSGPAQGPRDPTSRPTSPRPATHALKRQRHQSSTSSSPSSTSSPSSSASPTSPYSSAASSPSSPSNLARRPLQDASEAQLQQQLHSISMQTGLGQASSSSLPPSDVGYSAFETSVLHRSGYMGSEVDTAPSTRYPSPTMVAAALTPGAAASGLYSSFTTPNSPTSAFSPGLDHMLGSIGAPSPFALGPSVTSSYSVPGTGRSSPNNLAPPSSSLAYPPSGPGRKRTASFSASCGSLEDLLSMNLDVSSGFPPISSATGSATTTTTANTGLGSSSSLGGPSHAHRASLGLGGGGMNARRKIKPRSISTHFPLSSSSMSGPMTASAVLTTSSSASSTLPRLNEEVMTSGSSDVSMIGSEEHEGTAAGNAFLMDTPLFPISASVPTSPTTPSSNLAQGELDHLVKLLTGGVEHVDSSNLLSSLLSSSSSSASTHLGHLPSGSAASSSSSKPSHPSDHHLMEEGSALLYLLLQQQQQQQQAQSASPSSPSSGSGTKKGKASPSKAKGGLERSKSASSSSSSSSAQPLHPRILPDANPLIKPKPSPATSKGKAGLLPAPSSSPSSSSSSSPSTPRPGSHSTKGYHGLGKKSSPSSPVIPSSSSSPSSSPSSPSSSSSSTTTTTTSGKSSSSTIITTVTTDGTTTTTHTSRKGQLPTITTVSADGTIVVEKPYKCQIPGCEKSYKNPNGLKYHNLHGHCSGPKFPNGPKSSSSPSSSSSAMTHGSVGPSGSISSPSSPSGTKASGGSMGFSSSSQFHQSTDVLMDEATGRYHGIKKSFDPSSISSSSSTSAQSHSASPFIPTQRPVYKPYKCSVEECGKAYKNLNGLKYHVEHAHASGEAVALGKKARAKLAAAAAKVSPPATTSIGGDEEGDEGKRLSTFAPPSSKTTSITNNSNKIPISSMSRPTPSTLGVKSNIGGGNAVKSPPTTLPTHHGKIPISPSPSISTNTNINTKKKVTPITSPSSTAATTPSPSTTPTPLAPLLAMRKVPAPIMPTSLLPTGGASSSPSMGMMGPRTISPKVPPTSAIPPSSSISSPPLIVPAPIPSSTSSSSSSKGSTTTTSHGGNR